VARHEAMTVMHAGPAHRRRKHDRRRLVGVLCRELHSQLERHTLVRRPRAAPHRARPAEQVISIGECGYVLVPGHLRETRGETAGDRRCHYRRFATASRTALSAPHRDALQPTISCMSSCWRRLLTAFESVGIAAETGLAAGPVASAAAISCCANVCQRRNAGESRKDVAGARY